MQEAGGSNPLVPTIKRGFNLKPLFLINEHDMIVGIISTGYVGLPTGVGLAELGHNVICIDKDENKISALQNGQITLYEEGLEELLRKNFKSGKIKFTTSMQQGIADADVVLIAVGTPPQIGRASCRERV